MTYRDASTDASRDGSDQKRLHDPDVYPIDASVWTLADEKRADNDAPGTASDYAGTTSHLRDTGSQGGLRVDNAPYDADDHG